MQNEKKETLITLRYRCGVQAIFLISVLAIMLWGCVASDAIKAKFGVGTKEQNPTSTVVAKEIGEVDSSINYGGAGWVLLTTTVILIIIGTFALWSFKKLIDYKGMLSLVTTAVHQSDPHVKQAIKNSVKKHARTHKDGDKHRKCLSKECIKNGVFADQ